MKRDESPDSSRVCSVPYDAYGAHPGKGVSLLKFNGEVPDTFTCSYLLGSGRRAYHPTLRRFLSADSLSPFSRGGLNTYAYCLGDPVNKHDPSGTISLWVLAKKVLWIGSRIKALSVQSSGLKTLKEAAAWAIGVGGVMSSYGLPGGKELVTAGSAVKLGVKGFVITKPLVKKQAKKLASAGGPWLMDLADADFSPFVGPFAGRSGLDSQARQSSGQEGPHNNFSRLQNQVKALRKAPTS